MPTFLKYTFCGLSTLLSETNYMEKQKNFFIIGETIFIFKRLFEGIQHQENLAVNNSNSINYEISKAHIYFIVSSGVKKKDLILRTVRRCNLIEVAMKCLKEFKHGRTAVFNYSYRAF